MPNATYMSTLWWNTLIALFLGEFTQYYCNGMEFIEKCIEVNKE